MQVFDVLELAAEALKHSTPKQSYPEALARHAKAVIAVRKAMEIMEEQHNFVVTPEPEEA